MIASSTAIYVCYVALTMLGALARIKIRDKKKKRTVSVNDPAAHGSLVFGKFNVVVVYPE